MKKVKLTNLGKCMLFILLMIPAAAILIILAGIGTILDVLLRENKKHFRLLPNGMKPGKTP